MQRTNLRAALRVTSVLFGKHATGAYLNCQDNMKCSFVHSWRGSALSREGGPQPAAQPRLQRGLLHVGHVFTPRLPIWWGGRERPQETAGFGQREQEKHNCSNPGEAAKFVAAEKNLGQRFSSSAAHIHRCCLVK